MKNTNNMFDYSKKNIRGDEVVNDRYTKKTSIRSEPKRPLLYIKFASKLLWSKMLAKYGMAMWNAFIYTYEYLPRSFKYIEARRYNVIGNETIGMYDKSILKATQRETEL